MTACRAQGCDQTATQIINVCVNIDGRTIPIHLCTDHAEQVDLEQVLKPPPQRNALCVSCLRYERLPGRTRCEFCGAGDRQRGAWDRLHPEPPPDPRKFWR